MSRTSLGRLGLMFVSLLGLMALFSASAFAAGKPVVTASAVTNKTLNTATYNGTVNPNGASTTYKFEYGKSLLYGSSTTVTSAGAGSIPVAVKATLTGLEPGTTYHYRVSATNSFGTTVSEDVQFEMLLQWKIGGKTLAEVGGEPLLMHMNKEEPVTIERTITGKVAKMTCQQDWASKYAWISSEYNLPFTGCVLVYNGKEQKACKPKDITLHLNAFLMPSPTTQQLYMGPECAVGEEIRFDTGFAIGPVTAQKDIVVTPTAVTSSGWTVNYGPTEWLLGDANKGLTLGIS